MVGRVNHPPDIPKSEGQKSHFKDLPKVTQEMSWQKREMQTSP